MNKQARQIILEVLEDLYGQEKSAKREDPNSAAKIQEREALQRAKIQERKARRQQWADPKEKPIAPNMDVQDQIRERIAQKRQQAATPDFGARTSINEAVPLRHYAPPPTPAAQAAPTVSQAAPALRRMSRLRKGGLIGGALTAVGAAGYGANTAIANARKRRQGQPKQASSVVAPTPQYRLTRISPTAEKAKALGNLALVGGAVVGGGVLAKRVIDTIWDRIAAKKREQE